MLWDIQDLVIKGLSITFLPSEDLRHHIVRKPKLAHREIQNRVAPIGLLNERSAEVSRMPVASVRMKAPPDNSSPCYLPSHQQP